MSDRPMTSEEAAITLLMRDGAEIAAIVFDSIRAAAERAGRPVDRTCIAEGVAPLISAAWTLAKLAEGGDDATARRHFVALLRRHAEAIEALG